LYCIKEWNGGKIEAGEIKFLREVSRRCTKLDKLKCRYKEEIKSLSINNKIFLVEWNVTDS